MEMQMDMLGTCPVCHLDLRPGISMNAHLETHPKDMIVNAFMSWMQGGSAAAAGASGSNGAATIISAPYLRAPKTATTTAVQRNVQHVVDYRPAVVRQTNVRREPFQAQQQQHHLEQNQFAQSEGFYEQHVPPTEEFNQAQDQGDEADDQEQQLDEEHVYVEQETYFQEDEDGNFILCTSEEVLQHQHQQQSTTAIRTKQEEYKYLETEQGPAHQVQVNPPEYATAILEKENRKRQEEQAEGETAVLEKPKPPTTNLQQSAREQPKILSVYVLDASDNIDWPRQVQQDERNRLSPNAVLPCPLKKAAGPTIRAALEQQPSPTVRPVATSVIRTVVAAAAAESVKVELAEVVNEESVAEEEESAPTIILANDEVEREKVKKEEQEDHESLTLPELNREQPGTSNCEQLPPEESKPVTPPRPRRELRGNRPPKILKVTFKKPIVDEVGAVGEENQLLSPSKQSEEATTSKVCKKDVEQTISNDDDYDNRLEDGETEAPKSPVACSSGSTSSPATGNVLIVPKVEREEPVPGPSHYNSHNNEAVVVDPGMLQLKAEDCEEVFISQHSLIKMEAGEDEEDEQHMGCDPFGYNGNSVDVLVALNQSKLELDDENGVEGGGTGPPMKMFMNLKSETVIEELCLSESSSLCSMVSVGGAGAMERVSVNIRAEEVMPAKGEISEQESNADSELLWPSNTIETFDATRILPSYDTSVARESWNFGHANSSDNLTFNKLSSMMDQEDGQSTTPIKAELFNCDNYEAVAGPSDAQSSSADTRFTEPSCSQMAVSGSSSSSSRARRSQPYPCPGCPLSFRLFRQRKEHVIAQHEELLTKKQRYNYMRQCDKSEATSSFTVVVGDGNAAVAGRFAPHFGPSVLTFKRRIEHLSVIKLHRFLIEFNLKALKGTTLGQREDYKGMLQDFSQRRMYFCTECFQQFTTMREYRKHMAKHPVQCHTCAMEEEAEKEKKTKEEEEEAAAAGLGEEQQPQFKVEVIYLKEEEEEQGGTREVAETKFWNWRHFVEHQKMHLGLKEVITCMQCGKSFGSRRKLNLHASSHTRKSYHCTFCPRTFMHFFRLKEHKKRHHFTFDKMVGVRSSTIGTTSGGSGRQKDYLCPCGEVFHSAAKFAWHKETHDKNPKGCPYCRERFVHKNSLSRHIRLAHAEKYSDYKKDTVPCPVCNNRYIRTSLKTHLASHLKRAEFQCSICNKVLSTKWNLKIHRWTHNSRTQMPFKCTICPKAFMRESDLQTHINTHKAIRPFTCDYCGCQFSRKYNWVRHSREHELEKRFRCNHCGKTFHRAYYLKEHARSHTNERPFECTICGKTSTTKTNHNKHLKIHHARDVAATEG